MGYYFIQGTKPQTLAYALSDSPAGLAAWIAEKFYTWTDNDGSPESVISLDRILANISFYWFTNSVGSSFWPYYARHHREWPVTSANPVLIPTGYAEFPKEILRPPMSIAKETNTNIGQLLKRAKEQETGEKRKNIYMAAAAISVLALSGFIISQ